MKEPHEKTGDCFEVKPVFNPIVIFCRLLPIIIPFSILCFIFFVAINAHFPFNESAEPGSHKATFVMLIRGMFFLSGTLFLVIIPGTLFFITMGNYAKMIYRFKDREVQYYEGFITINEATIAYNKILEVSLRQGVVQRMFGLGTIILSTAATETGNGPAYSGLNVQDIQDPEMTYGIIKGIIKPELS